MKIKKHILLISLILLLSCLLFVPQITISAEVDPSIVNWMKTNVSSITKLPYSFDIPLNKEKEIYENLGKADSLTGIIERTIVNEGISIYDAAVWQIALVGLGRENIEQASIPTRIYWKGSVRDFKNIRAGYFSQNFVYDPIRPQVISSDINKKGDRGFLFRIINANGKYNSYDPLDGKTEFAGYPNWPTIHWEDWKPIAGENAWAVMGALHIYHKKYFNFENSGYGSSQRAVELLLSEEIARAALYLQSKTGGIRMAPIGTYYHQDNLDKLTDTSPESIAKLFDENAEKSLKEKAPVVKIINNISYTKNHLWYYNEISTENNISWYAAFRMLYEITKDSKYKIAMNDIEKYFYQVWNEHDKYFYQGMNCHETDDWIPNNDIFASDVQNWIIVALGAEKIDQMFGEGTAYKVWKTTKEKSGVYDKNYALNGIGYVPEHDRISIEWTLGAIFATKDIAQHYKFTHTKWSEEAALDAKNMRNGIEQYRIQLSENLAAYSYSSRRGWIPFGWFSHQPEILSLTSTGWVILDDLGINPFILQQK